MDIRQIYATYIGAMSRISHTGYFHRFSVHLKWEYEHFFLIRHSNHILKTPTLIFKMTSLVFSSLIFVSVVFCLCVCFFPVVGVFILIFKWKKNLTAFALFSQNPPPRKRNGLFFSLELRSNLYGSKVTVKITFINVFTNMYRNN